MPPRALATSHQWKKDGAQEGAVRKAESCDVALLTPAQLKAAGLEETDRAMVWTFSTEARDRDGDRIMVNGWQLKNFRRNPVIQWAHNYQQLPIGQALKVWRDIGSERKRLRGVIKFAGADENPFADMVFRLAANKVLKAGSVGFIPLKAEIDPEDDRDVPDWAKGYLFHKQDLLEFSIVPIPSNPEALEGAKSLGIDLAPMRKWAEQELDSGNELILPRKEIEQVYLISGGDKSLHSIEGEEDIEPGFDPDALTKDITPDEPREDKTPDEPQDPLVKAVEAMSRAASAMEKIASRLVSETEEDPAKPADNSTDEPIIRIVQ